MGNRRRSCGLDGPGANRTLNLISQPDGLTLRGAARIRP